MITHIIIICMMKKLILLAAIMMATTCAFAQHEPGSFTLQPRIGFSAADFHNTSDTKARVGLVVGPEFEYTIANRFSLAFGINYSQQGAEINKTDIKYKTDYLTVPIVANFYLAKWFALKAGVQPGYNLSAKFEANGVKADVDDDALKKFDLSIPVGLSFEFYNIVIDARYNFGLTKLFDTKYLDLDSKNLAFQLTLGYKIRLF